MKAKLKGKFKKLIYSSNNFHILSFRIFLNQKEQKEILKLSNSNNSINVILKENDIDLTLDYEIEIEKVVRPNSKYPISYYLINKEIIILDEDESMIRYLSSSLFKGISKKTASKIVEKFSRDFVNHLDNIKDELIKLIGIHKSQIIFETLKNNSELNELSQIFIREDLSMSLLKIFHKKIKKNIKKYLEMQLFEILEDYPEIDYLELDKIASHFYKNYSIDTSNKYLIFSQILKIENKGSTVNSLQDIYYQVIKYKSISVIKYKEYIKSLIEENKIIFFSNNKCLSSKIIYEKEKFICQKLLDLSNKTNIYNINKSQIFKDNLDQFQTKALVESLINSFYIITGGPGTGKTLLINLIVNNLKKQNIKKIELLAPTGKAATQISSRTKMQAKTFHSFLRWNGEEFDVNEKKNSDVEVIIIDEFSMIDINIFYSLLIATPKLKHLIIVGDKDQLPSIGPGYLLNDLIISNKFKISELKNIYRQSEGSLIAKNSQLIKKNEYPIFDKKESILFEIDSNSNIYQIILDNLKLFLEKDQNLFNYQILIPMYSNEYGIDNINLNIQKYLNKNNEVLFKVNETNFYKNDKVIQLENNVEKNVFNGEIGKIYDVVLNSKNKLEKIKIIFDQNKIIEYTLSEFNNELKLAYAISIHKFQGSESNEILLIILDEHKSMLSKKLFYTAYTRAKQKITIISKKTIIEYCLFHDTDSNRKCNILNLLTFFK